MSAATRALPATTSVAQQAASTPADVGLGTPPPPGSTTAGVPVTAVNKVYEGRPPGRLSTTIDLPLQRQGEAITWAPPVST